MIGSVKASIKYVVNNESFGLCLTVDACFILFFYLSLIALLILVMDTRAIEGSGLCEVDSKAPRNWDQIKLPGIHPSMSMTDLMNHLGNCISEQMTSGNQPLSEEGPECREILEGIAQYLLSDTQLTTASDEKLMSRVNSLCCLLQKDPGSTQNLQQLSGESSAGKPNNGGNENSSQPNSIFELMPDTTKPRGDMKTPEVDTKDIVSPGSKPTTTGMSRKDSFSDLLLHLPRIASLPKFLFNISEDDHENRAR